MIVPTTTTTLKQSESFESVSFGIDQEDMSHICKLLRSNIYSDKIRAVIREYSANAIDAQIEAGNGDRPISVTLPSPLSLAFKVRDYGTGLSEEDVKTIYSKYGKSTKRKTNLAIGEKGLGSKSGFAYGDNFLIRSFQDGVVTLYNAFIDPSQVGKIAKLHSEPTTEENGVEIEIPVNERDMRQFKDKAESIFKYFKIPPTVKGVKDYEPLKVQTLFEGTNFKFVKYYYDDDANNSYRHNQAQSHHPTAIMGNISYPLDIQAVNWGEESDLKKVLSNSILVEFNLGELETATSREGLEYSTHTQRNIIARARQIKDECLAEVRSKLADGKSMFEAKKIYNQIFHNFNYESGTHSLNFLSGILKKSDLKFNGKDLTSGSWNPIDALSGKFANVSLYSVKRPSRSRDGKAKVRGEAHHRITATEGSAYVIKDMKSGITNRIAPLCEMDDNHLGRVFKNVYLIEPGPEYEKWVKDDQFDAPTINLSDLPKVSLKDLGYVRSYSTGNSTVNSKHSENVFKPIFDLGVRAYSSNSKSDYFEPTNVDFEAGGVWFEIDRFVPTNHAEYNATENYIKTLKKSCTFLGLDHEKVVAVKVKDSDKFKKSDKWQKVEEWVEENSEKYIVDNKIEQKLADQMEYDQAKRSGNGAYFKIITTLYVDLDNQSKEMATLGKHMTEMRHESFDETKQTIERIRFWTGTEQNKSKSVCKPTHDLANEWKAAQNKYPMYLQVNSWDITGDGRRQKIIDYVNMVDSTEAK